MAKMKVEDLQRIKEARQGSVNLRAGNYRAKVTVHMGTCGIAAGARNVMSAMLDELAASGLDDVIVTSSGCAGLCSREPMMTVEIQEQAPVKYVDLDAEKTRKIFASHVAKGQPVPEYALAIGSETTY